MKTVAVALTLFAALVVTTGSSLAAPTAAECQALAAPMPKIAADIQALEAVVSSMPLADQVAKFGPTDGPVFFEFDRTRQAMLLAMKGYLEKLYRVQTILAECARG